MSMTDRASTTQTLGEAACNRDGSWDGYRALAWLSAALHPGRGLSEREVRALVLQQRIAAAIRTSPHRSATED